MSWHWADLCLRPEPTSLTPPTRRRRWLVACGGYAAFSSSPPAILIVVTPDFLSVAPQFGEDLQSRCTGLELQSAGYAGEQSIAMSGAEVIPDPT
jgi:hypothetical protein